jgi:hypothetical protein
MMNKQLLAAALISAITLISGSAMSQERTGTLSAKPQAVAVSDKAARHASIYKIVREWGPYVHTIYGENIGLWADRMVPTFRQADTAKLQAATRANTFEDMNNALLGQKSRFSAGIAAGIVPKSLGSTVSDLTYTSLPGCILVDTRVAGGAFATGVTRHFKASGPNFTAQGGSNTNCGIPTTPVSLVLSVAAISPTGNGYFRAWPYSTTKPLASVISYRTGQNIQNDIILKMSQGLTQDFSVESASGSHLVVNVLGYFAAPAATALDCKLSDYSAAVVLNTTTRNGSATAPACATGYSSVAVIPDLSDDFYNASLVTANADSAFYHYSGATSANFIVARRCCRVPGR